jgi:MFS family permease
LAGGGLQPSSQGVLLDAFPQEKQGQAQTLFGIAALLVPVVGPTLGGYITDNYGWRWIFYLNVPVGALALIMCSGTGAANDCRRTSARARHAGFIACIFRCFLHVGSACRLSGISCPADASIGRGEGRAHRCGVTLDKSASADTMLAHATSDPPLGRFVFDNRQR